MMRRSMRVLAILALLAMLPLGAVLPSSRVAAQTPITCDGLDAYIAALTTWGEQLEGAIPEDDNGELEDWTSEQFTAASEAIDAAVIELEAIDPPDVAAEYHELLIEQISLFSDMFATMATAGVFGALIYIDQADALSQQAETAVADVEAACGVNLEEALDEAEDGPAATPVIEIPAADTSSFDDEDEDLDDDISTALPDGTGTRANPIPMGQAVAIDDDWELTVLSVTPDATDLVMNEFSFNDPPEDGHKFFIARVRVTYTGDDSDSFYAWDLKAVGQSAVSYNDFDDYCGSIPDELSTRELFPGGSIEGNLCWAIASEDADSLVLYNSDQDSDERVFLSMIPTEDSATPETGESAGALSSVVTTTVAEIGQPATAAASLVVSDTGFAPASVTVSSDALPATISVSNTGATSHSFTVVELDIDVVIEPGAQVDITIPAGSSPGIYPIESVAGGATQGGLAGALVIE